MFMARDTVSRSGQPFSKGVMVVLCFALTMAVMIMGRPSSYMNSQRSHGQHCHLVWWIRADKHQTRKMACSPFHWKYQIIRILDKIVSFLWKGKIERHFQKVLGCCILKLYFFFIRTLSTTNQKRKKNNSFIVLSSHYNCFFLSFEHYMKKNTFIMYMNLHAILLLGSHEYTDKWPKEKDSAWPRKLSMHWQNHISIKR